ncbi:MAG TPA: putative manganese-dependent inorganic diphosphatase [Verrucomicrobiales bacterium]|nr:putative manganese-dependent inorganic diphosphatase [Verrucomicrobiales bacterium]
MIHATYESTGAGKQPIFVIGHLNPDTDAICSAIGYAELLQRKRHPDAVAACCGGLNQRTAWVLKRAGIEPPRLLMDLRPTTEMICRADVVKARADETFLDVYRRMEREGIRSIPVVDEKDRVTGLASVQDLLKLLVHNAEDKAQARRVRTTLTNMARTLEGHIDCGALLDSEQDFILTVSASSQDTVDTRLHQFPPEELVVVVGDRPEVHRLALNSNVRAIVLTNAAHLAPDLQETARTQGCTVISCRHDTATTTQLIRCSRCIAEAVDREFKSYGARVHLHNIRQEILQSPQPLFPVVREESGQLMGVFSKSDLLDPPRQRLILVDHNELSQAVPGAPDAAILEVIDHHRLSGNLVSREPIRFINEPVGSTSTIVAQLYQMQGEKPTKGVALCLCAGIVSDTLCLTSPTARGLDREMLAWLAEHAEISIDEFAREFFAAGSLLRAAPVEAILNTDRKEFTEHGWHISISQIEELGLDDLPRRSEELRVGLETLRIERDCEFACLIVTDINRHYSVLLTAGSRAVVEEIDYPPLGPDQFEMDGVVSRKKQFFPFISRVLARAVKES